jgi:hypothetical protein
MSLVGGIGETLLKRANGAKVRGMPKRERQTLTLDDPEGLQLHAAWSRSGARLGIAVWREAPLRDYHQVGLRPDQVEQLIQFLTETLARDPGER